MRLRGFTLVELLVVMVIVSVLIAIALPRYAGSVDRAKEAVLRQNLALTREAIDKYFADTGRYPDAIHELVDRRYLRAMPRDPMTDSVDSWREIAPDNLALGRVYDIRSGAPGAGRDGVPYDQW